MKEYEIELMIGDTLHVGNQTFTVIDIEGGEVSFRVQFDNPTSGGAGTSVPPEFELNSLQTRPR